MDRDTDIVGHTRHRTKTNNEMKGTQLLTKNKHEYLC